MVQISVYPVTTRATEYSILPVKQQVSIPSRQGKVTFPSHFRPCSPITACGDGDFDKMEARTL